jgi:hypothetical protein
VPGTTTGILKIASSTATGSVSLTPASAASNVTATLPANTGTIAELNLAESFSAIQTFAGGGIGSIKVDRIMAVGSAPTCTFTSGGGTSPSCTVKTGSTDAAGILTLTTGTGSPGSNGSVTLTFSANYGTNPPSCIFFPSQANTGQWVQSTTLTADFFDKTPAVGSDLENWQNGSTTLATSTAFDVNYHCWAK